jgi:hypothetical protein
MEVLVPVDLNYKNIVSFNGVTSELDLTDPVYGSTYSVTSTLSGSSLNNAVTGASNARDIQVPADCWIANAPTGTYTITFDEARTVSGYELVSPQNSTNDALIEPALNSNFFTTGIKGFTVDVYISGSWTTVDTFTTNTKIIQTTFTAVQTNVTAIRFSITAMVFGAAAAIGRVRVFGELNAWSNTKAYGVGYRVKKNGTVYENIQAGNLGKDPELSTNALFWLAVKKDNQQALFDNKLGNSCQMSRGSLVFEFRTGKNNFDTLALLDVDAYDVTYEIVDNIRYFNPPTSNTLVFSTNSLRQSGTVAVVKQGDALIIRGLSILGDRTVTATDRIEYKERIILTLTKPGSDGVINPNNLKNYTRIGELVIGNIKDLGLTQYGATAGITSYSTKTTDIYGNTSITKRPTAKTMQIKAEVPKADTNRVHSLLTQLESLPCVWIGTTDSAYSTPLIVYGFFKDFSTSIDYPSYSMCNINIEGLT